MVRNGWEAKTLGMSFALGVLVVPHAIDALVAGGAPVVTGNFLEVVIDGQLGKADLLDLGGRRGHVDARQTAKPGEQAEVLGLFLVEQPLDAVGFAGQLLSFFLQVIDDSPGAFPSPLASPSAWPRTARAPARAGAVPSRPWRPWCSGSAWPGISSPRSIMPSYKAAQAVQFGLLELPLGVEVLRPGHDPVQFAVQPFQVGGPLRGSLLGLLDLLVDPGDLGLILRLLLLERLALRGLELGALDLRETRAGLASTGEGGRP